MDSTTILSPDDAAADDEIVAPQVLLVRVAGSCVALRLADVRGVLRGGRVVRLPGAPRWVGGLSPARGTLVPIAHLSRLAAPDADDRLPEWRVLVEHGDRLAFLAVDAVDGVHTVDGDEPPPDDVASSTLPRTGAVRLQSQGASAAPGGPAAADVLDVGAVFRELFEED